MSNLLTLLVDVAPTLPANGTKVAGWAAFLSGVVYVIGWLLKQPGLGSWLESLSPKQKRAAMLGIAAAVGAIGTLTNDHMNSTETWMVWIGTIVGPTFLHEQGAKGLARPSEVKSSPV